MKRIGFFLFVFIATVSAKAQDRYFGYTYTTNVLPKGAIDLELWHTSRIGHLNQFYHAQDQRLETEFGLGKNWQTAFYFNRYQTRFSTGANGTESVTELGFSNEWKVKLSDPIKTNLVLLCTANGELKAVMNWNWKQKQSWINHSGKTYWL